MQLSACEAAKGLFVFGPKSGSIQTAHHEKELDVWYGLMQRDCETGLRCGCVWEWKRRRDGGGGSASRTEEAQLSDIQTKRACFWASVDRYGAAWR